MSVKLLMTWNIIPGREQDYFEFVVRDFVPGMQRLGLEPSDAWFTVFGNQPQIMTGAVMPTLAAMHKMLASDDWRGLLAQLTEFVTNYQHKIIPARGGFQL